MTQRLIEHGASQIKGDLAVAVNVSKIEFQDLCLPLQGLITFNIKNNIVGIQRS